MNILYISTKPLNHIATGDRVVIFNRLVQLHKMHDISLIFLYSNDEELVGMTEIYSMCKNVWCFKRSRVASFFSILINFLFSNDPIQVLYYKSSNINRKIQQIIKDNDFKLINVFLIRGLPYALNSDVPVVLDMIDSMQLNFLRRTQNEKNYFVRKFYSYELDRVMTYENNLPDNVIKTLFVAEKDSREILSKKEVVSLGIDTHKFCPTHKENKKTIIFSGNMAYAPNIQAVRWFLDHCFYEICEKADNDVSFLIAGINPSQEILSYQSANIIVTGYVDSMAEVISRSSVSIAPMQSGSGMQNKILEAMACEVPVVTTTLGLGDIKALPDKEVIVKESPEQFIDAVLDILNFDDKYFELSKSARKFVIDNHSWQEHALTVAKIYNEAAGNKSF